MITFDKSPLFDGELGERLYQKVCEFIDKHSMKEPIEKGVLVGFSGGPDSIFLLEFLSEYKKREKSNFKIIAVHVNHSIRGEEADFDEELSRKYSKKLGIEFIARKVDAKGYANENRESLEEAARNLRYNVFSEIIKGRKDVSTVATAHNSGDNFETVIFNMMRGAGLRGVSGITPRRDNIIRPILSISKHEIIKLLDGKNIKYALDSTNSSTEYTRNYIRHEIIPKFSRLANNPDDMVTRLSESLRTDNEFIEIQAREYYRENVISGKIPAKQLSALHPALKSRVISYLAESSGISLEKVHISQIQDLLTENNFKISLPKGYEFICEAGECHIDLPRENEEFFYKLSL
ncbi:MAG: tRNA lysidine(34) synthetase TilS, partial [Clostridia bacterium]|nr:tRNA lysidine(34) synthetase TilS [Clostridia bacterium]